MRKFQEKHSGTNMVKYFKSAENADQTMRRKKLLTTKM
jgi:hypothetical protein